MADFSQESSSFKLFGTVIVADQNRPMKSLTPPSPPRLRPACPRCNSHQTKFCYFNNYNVNQPRHFCKACHRYWTAGGALRNVPVGAGRRRSRLYSRPEDGGSDSSAEGRDCGTECGAEIGRWRQQLPASGRNSSNAAGDSC